VARSFLFNSTSVLTFNVELQMHLLVEGRISFRASLTVASTSSRAPLAVCGTPPGPMNAVPCRRYPAIRPFSDRRLRGGPTAGASHGLAPRRSGSRPLPALSSADMHPRPTGRGSQPGSFSGRLCPAYGLLWILSHKEAPYGLLGTSRFAWQRLHSGGHQLA